MMHTYDSASALRNELLEYLLAEKQFCEEDIQNHQALSDDEKVQLGLLIKEAKVVSHQSDDYELSLSENNTKLRPGDKVQLTQCGTKKRTSALVLENTETKLQVKVDGHLSDDITYTVEVRESVLLDSMIKLMESIEEGAPGSYWLALLAGLEEPDEYGLGSIPLAKVKTFPDTLNPQQREVCELMLRRPSLSILQGPPGTGKTDVLATIANTFSVQGKEVLIISNTHQAVNNALNKLHKVNSQLPIIKIGEPMKAVDLHEDIVAAETYSNYLVARRQTPKKKGVTKGDIVGMTFQAAVVNLGLRNSGFKPSIILVDEAGQMPLVQGALIGSFGSGSILFIGDDRQMPPIFHQKLSDHKFSQSIFTYLCNCYPSFKRALTTTYRMNDEITALVSKKFYEPYGVELVASDYSAARRLPLESTAKDTRIRSILESQDSIYQLNVSENLTWEDYNPEEAVFIAHLIAEAMKSGLTSTQLAVITPYRRQVKAIRQCLLDVVSTSDDMPLIDTVERLQGQDVEMIIISMCTTCPRYYEQQKDFLTNPNRMNVMISRAKKKVVIVMK